MANPENLVPNEKRTPSERRANAKKAGLASGAARRRRKTFKELLDIALQKELDGEGTYGEAVVASMIEAALAGDVKAFVAIRDTVGEKPVEKTSSEIAGGLSISWDQAAAAKAPSSEEEGA